MIDIENSKSYKWKNILNLKKKSLFQFIHFLVSIEFYNYTLVILYTQSNFKKCLNFLYIFSSAKHY